MGELIGTIIFIFIIYKILESLNKKTEPAKHFHPTPTLEFTVEHTENKYFYRPTSLTIDFMKALVFIGKSDGKLLESERLVIIEYLKNAQPEHVECPDYWLHEDIKTLPLISSEEFKTYIESLTGKEIQLLLFWAKKVASTQKSMHAFTEHLLLEIENRALVVGADYEIVDGVRQYRLN